MGVVPLAILAYRVRAFSVARDGSMSVLYEHSEEIGDRKWSHIARVLPDGRSYVAFGPMVGDTPFIGRSPDRMKGGPDGSLWIGAGFAELRLLAPDGKLVWRSAGAINSDKNQLAELATARKGKVLVADRGG